MPFVPEHTSFAFYGECHAWAQARSWVGPCLACWVAALPQWQPRFLIVCQCTGRVLLTPPPLASKPNISPPHNLCHVAHWEVWSGAGGRSHDHFILSSHLDTYRVSQAALTTTPIGNSHLALLFRDLCIVFISGWVIFMWVALLLLVGGYTAICTRAAWVGDRVEMASGRGLTWASDTHKGHRSPRSCCRCPWESYKCYPAWQLGYSKDT